MDLIPSFQVYLIQWFTLNKSLIIFSLTLHLLLSPLNDSFFLSCLLVFSLCLFLLSLSLCLFLLSSLFGLFFLSIHFFSLHYYYHLLYRSLVGAYNYPTSDWLVQTYNQSQNLSNYFIGHHLCTN